MSFISSLLFIFLINSYDGRITLILRNSTNNNFEFLYTNAVSDYIEIEPKEITLSLKNNSKKEIVFYFRRKNPEGGKISFIVKNRKGFIIARKDFLIGSRIESKALEIVSQKGEIKLIFKKEIGNKIDIKFYDVSGRKIKELKLNKAGKKEERIIKVPSGVYFYNIDGIKGIQGGKIWVP